MKWNVVVPEAPAEIHLVLSVDEAHLFRLLVSKCYTGSLPFDTTPLYQGLGEALAVATKQSKQTLVAPFKLWSRKLSFNANDRNKPGFIYDDQFGIGTKDD